MTTVIRIRPDRKYGEWITVEADTRLTAFGSFRGQPMAEDWVPKEVMWYSEGGNLVKSDCNMAFGLEPVLNERSVEVLSKYLDGKSELLPLICGEERLYALNVTHCIEGLDQENSEIKYFKDGAIQEVTKYAFLPGVVTGETIFKIRELFGSPVFVTNSFVESYIKAKLTGFKFEEVWRESGFIYAD